MKDKEKVEQFMRIYKQEEIESMNYILGKPESNLVFTKEENDLGKQRQSRKIREIYENIK